MYFRLPKCLELFGAFFGQPVFRRVLDAPTCIADALFFCRSGNVTERSPPTNCCSDGWPANPSTSLPQMRRVKRQPCSPCASEGPSASPHWALLFYLSSSKVCHLKYHDRCAEKEPLSRSVSRPFELFANRASETTKKWAMFLAGEGSHRDGSRRSVIPES